MNVVDESDSRYSKWRIYNITIRRIHNIKYSTHDYANLWQTMREKEFDDWIWKRSITKNKRTSIPDFKMLFVQTADISRICSVESSLCTLIVTWFFFLISCFFLCDKLHTLRYIRGLHMLLFKILTLTCSIRICIYAAYLVGHPIHCLIPNIINNARYFFNKKKIHEFSKSNLFIYVFHEVNIIKEKKCVHLIYFLCVSLSIKTFGCQLVIGTRKVF